MNSRVGSLPFKGVKAGFRIACDPPPKRRAHTGASAVCKTARVGTVVTNYSLNPIPLPASPLKGEGQKAQKAI
jgi:hypothetical protein